MKTEVIIFLTVVFLWSVKISAQESRIAAVVDSLMVQAELDTNCYELDAHEALWYVYRSGTIERETYVALDWLMGIDNVDPINVLKVYDYYNKTNTTNIAIDSLYWYYGED